MRSALLILLLEATQPQDRPPAFSTWPGSAAIATADAPGAFEGNLSGLTYQSARGDAPPILWAVQNGPALLHRLVKSDAAWVDSAGEGWGAGKSIVYPDRTGAPDAE